jgi:hypothetical protein
MVLLGWNRKLMNRFLVIRLHRFSVVTRRLPARNRADPPFGGGFRDGLRA